MNRNCFHLLEHEHLRQNKPNADDRGVFFFEGFVCNPVSERRMLCSGQIVMVNMEEFSFALSPECISFFGCLKYPTLQLFFVYLFLTVSIWLYSSALGVKHQAERIGNCAPHTAFPSSNSTSLCTPFLITSG